MGSIAPDRQRKRRGRGKWDLTELDWGDRYRKIQHELEDGMEPEEEDESDEGCDDDWEDWGPPPGLWEEDELD